MAQEGGKVVSPLPPSRKYSWYSFLLESDNPRATLWPERLSIENSNNIRNRTRDLPLCSAVSQPTAPPLQFSVSCEDIEYFYCAVGQQCCCLYKPNETNRTSNDTSCLNVWRTVACSSDCYRLAIDSSCSWHHFTQTASKSSYRFHYLRAVRSGIESRLGRDFPHLSRPAVGPSHPPIQWIPSLSRG